MHTTQLLVLLGGAKLGVELVLRESGVKLRIRRQIAFLGGGWSFRTDSARIYTLYMLKKIGIDWNLIGRFGSIVHLPSDDLRQVFGGNTVVAAIRAGAAAPKPSAPLVCIPPMSAPQEGIWRLCRDLGEMGKLWR